MTSAAPQPPAEDATGRAIAFILAAMLCISVNDMTIKQLSGGYPLHQMVFVRSAIGIGFSLILVQFEGGWRILKTRRPGLHLLRALLLVFANMTFFAGLAVLPLATATALFFVAPLFITLLSIPVLGEPVGPRRLAAVALGFAGVLVMMLPAAGNGDPAGGATAAMLLPVFAALGYAGMQVLTRKLGIASKASAMAVYIQGTFIVVSLVFYAVAGDGRLAEGQSNDSLVFLLRAWVWPAPQDWPWFALLGLMSAMIGYCLSQAYRLANAATVAPFEYSALPMAVFWGWLIFDEWPGPPVLAGIALIAGAGVYVFVREGRRARPLAARRPLRRW
jgi:S-adenosylmethionine uptake transporter